MKLADILFKDQFLIIDLLDFEILLAYLVLEKFFEGIYSYIDGFHKQLLKYRNYFQSSSELLD